MPSQSTQNGNSTSENDSRVPKWLKAELFESVLKDTKPGFRSITDMRILSGTGAGENYATIMLRVKVDFENSVGATETVAYMLKTAYPSELFEIVVSESNIFEIERGIYLEVVPELEEIYHQVGVDVKFGASAYELNTPEHYVLLEDLQPKGFSNADRLAGLDTEHTECALRKLAYWHAASAVRVDTKGAYPEKLSRGFFCRRENKDFLNMMSEGVQKTFFDTLQNYDGHEHYIEDAKNLQSKLTDELLKLDEIDPHDFNALNHGDFWSNNIMFQYDEEGKVKETYFVDFQIPKYGAVAQDLVYFLLTSTELSIKLSKFEYFVKYYHSHLIANLKLLKYKQKLPTLKGLHASLYKYGAFAYFAVVNIMIAVLMDSTEKAEFDTLFKTDAKGLEFKTMGYNNPRYRKHMEAILPWLQQRGALE